jgi:hypothetical protein
MRRVSSPFTSTAIELCRQRRRGDIEDRVDRAFDDR